MTGLYRERRRILLGEPSPRRMHPRFRKETNSEGEEQECLTKPARPQTGIPRARFFCNPILIRGLPCTPQEASRLPSVFVPILVFVARENGGRPRAGTRAPKAGVRLLPQPPERRAIPVMR